MNELDWHTTTRSTGNNGDPRKQTFLRLFEESMDELRSYIGTLVIHVADADDVFQELCLTLWDRFDEFEPGTNFLAWARTVAFNSARTYWKRQSRRGKAALSPQLLQVFSRAHKGHSEFLELRRELVRNCLREMSESDKRFVTEVYEGNQSISKLAKQQRKTVDSLYKRLSRLREKLRQCVERRSND
ncbi:sigma-70 family RNA polymerase sigma factor [Calycomorphotria hydatis]|uniref:sigma-70 family RNA polymerase sigma factor n=1 Tax=Calycomorphotria hydatis TaxID=2528027 RepID=UPI0011A486DA|nr:sigma-70 family RNA polymerase sigma factor [Calycomorphotria hydatis]